MSCLQWCCNRSFQSRSTHGTWYVVAPPSADLASFDSIAVCCRRASPSCMHCCSHLDPLRHASEAQLLLRALCLMFFTCVCVCEAFGVWISFSHQLPPPPLLLLFFRFPSPATGFLRLMNPFLGSLPSVSAHFCSNDWISCGSFAVYVCLCRKTRVRRLLLPSDQECEE